MTAKPIKSGPWTAAEIERLRTLAAQGHSQAQCAAVLGRSRSSCGTKAYRAGFDFGGRAWTSRRPITLSRGA